MNWTNARYYRLQEIEEERKRLEAFYTESLPCECCGHPAPERAYDATLDLYVGECCTTAEITLPQEPTCPVLTEAIDRAETVLEVSRIFKQHQKEYCQHCSLLPEKRSVSRAGEVGTGKRRNAA